MERVEQVSQRHETTNGTGRYLLVGNYHVILGSHATAEGAEAARRAIGCGGPDGLAETPYARLDVLAPGATIGGVLMTPVIWDDGEEIDVEALFFGAAD